MTLTPEWARRIDNWRRELARQCYRALGTVELEGYTTFDQLTVTEAQGGPFAPMPPGTRWGAKWEYAWFRTEVVVPPEAAGERFVVALEPGGESAVYVNGVAAGAHDRHHREITLATEAVPGTRYQIMIEAYAGHGPRVAGVGPVPPGRETVPEPPPTQACVGTSTYGIWEEDVYQLRMDVETLYGLRNAIDPDALRVAEIDAGLRDFTLIVDFEVEREEFLASVRAARERLRDLLACVNGSTAPTMYMFGHSHIDVAWLWPLAETERKCVRTLATQLALAAEYPEYRYLQSQPHLYTMVKDRYPDLYERVVEAVRAGQIIPEGATWVEPDTNVPSGESLIRQFLHGTRFFREELGVECKMLWLPDVFGYSGALPQIMRGCGIRFFSTAKIFWAYNGGDPFPYVTFVWEGIDGSEVYVNLCRDYNAHTNPEAIIERWNERLQKDGYSTRLYPFGYGDGGGGPTRDHIEFLRRMGDLEGVPRCRIASPIEYFADQEAKGWPEARYVGELYFQAHRGTYTSQARTKRGNRKSELALREAEMWGAAAGALTGYAYPLERMDAAWKTVLLNHFHDIIPGSSIHRVYEEAEAAYDQVIDTAEEVAGEAAGTLTDAGNDLTAFNSLSWERSALVPLPEGYRGALNAAGRLLPTQTSEGETYTEAILPSCGWTTLRPTAEPGVKTPNELSASPTHLENALLRVTFNERGEITSIVDKETGREWATGVCNQMRMFKDVPTNWDAWDIDSTYQDNPVPLNAPAEIAVVAEGPLFARLRVTRPLLNSAMRQEITLRRGSRRIDFDTEIDWQESHKLLKVAFPVDIHADEAIHEIQFGHIRRPTHRSRPFDADRFEVAQQRWTALAEENRGAAVLNDCKYGVNVLGNVISLSVLKSALAPDMTADKGQQVFTYALYLWNGSLLSSNVVCEAYDLNVPIMTVSGSAGERSLFNVDAPNVVIDTVKLAEDGSGDIVVRLYDAQRAATRCTLRTSLPIAAARLTDMLERDDEPVEVRDGAMSLAFRAFEIKTVRLTPVERPS